MRRSVLVLLALVAVTTTGCGRPCKDIAVYMIQPDGSGKHRVKPAEPHEDMFSARWLPGGHRVAFTDLIDWWSMNADGSDLRPLSGVGRRFADPSSKELTWIWRSGERVGFRVRRNGKARRKLIYNAVPSPAYEDDSFPRLSPDRRLVVYVDGPKGVHNSWEDLYVIDSGGGPPRRLTRSTRQHNDLSPVWSPDSRKIAFVRDQPTLDACTTCPPAVYLVGADGSGERLIARDADAVAWSPDGRELVISNHSRGTWSLSTVDLHGDLIKHITTMNYVNLGLAWAPANTIVYITDEGDETQAKCGD